ncbi:MAG TPA: hypothetical protein DIW23_11260 [Anaerolineae bacterium]|nr:hypothetical protein [Anaerolineae bacterium]
MAKVRKNLIIQGLSGSLGEQLVIRHDRAGRTIVAVSPSFDPDRTFSEAQQETQERFRQATAYAKVAKDEDVYVEKADGKAVSAYNVAVADWFHAPEILEVDMSAWDGVQGQIIRVKVLDDVQVTQVNVVITDEQGDAIEQGSAVQQDGLWWSYTTTENASGTPRVIASARDLPGNIGQLEVENNL